MADRFVFFRVYSWLKMPTTLQAFIQALPKTETHLHVEGALPYELLTAWDPSRYPEDPPFRRANFRYPTFPDFERTLLDNALPWFTSAERYYEATKVMFAKHVAQNVRYVETSFHLPVTQFINVPGPEIVAAILAAAPPGLEVRVFAGMLRSDISGDLRPTIDQLHTWTNLAGVDLHGFEQMPTEPDTAGVWAKLRAAGKVTKCHAGEFDGPGRVREAIEELGVTRVQHGVRAIEDPAVVRLAIDRGVTFDVCPISNVRLKVVHSLADHPIRRLMEAGVRCTVSTDDPLCFANSVTDEYLALAGELSFTHAELARVAVNGWEVASVSSDLRKSVLEEIRQVTISADHSEQR
ncbi:MAG: Adenosine deaminase [Verrucomicrobia bacterium]|nr:Adenosine deaminase [Verrucomicrobiota bacterium]